VLHILILIVVFFVTVFLISLRKKKKKRALSKATCFCCDHIFFEGECVYEKMQTISRYAITGTSGPLMAAALAGNLKELSRPTIFTKELLDRLIFPDSMNGIIANRCKILNPAKHKGEVVQRILICQNCENRWQEKKNKAEIREYLIVLPFFFLLLISPLIFLIYYIFTNR